MTRELLYKGVVLELVICFLLSKYGLCTEAREIPDIGVIPENKVICQGNRLRLRCGNSSMGLIIYSALYGRTEPGHVICPYKGDEYDQNYNCGEADVTEKLKAMCATKSKCKVKVQSALFGDPCPYTHSYLNLVYACELQRRKRVLHTSSSTVATATSTSTGTSYTLLSSTLIVSFSSIAISPTVNTTTTSSAVLSSLEYTTVQTTTAEPNDPSANGVHTLQVEQAGSTANSGAGSFGITGTLFVWFLFMQDHSSDCITVFFATATGALALALIAGAYTYFRHQENKQQLHVKEEPKLSGFGTTDSKAFQDAADPTPPPEYVFEGYNWNGESVSPHKSVRNGSVSRTYHAKDLGQSKNVGPNEVNGHNRYVRKVDTRCDMA